MPLVIDASVAACWAFDDEGHPTAVEALERLRRDQAIVPRLWRFELCNVLTVSQRRGRLGEDRADRFLRLLSRLPILIDVDPDEAELMRTAQSHHLSAYDAAYLELALREGAPLATLDDKLADAAKAAGAEVI